MSTAPVRWNAIAALNAVSALSQIGQFGIGFMVLPVWLAHRGLDAPRAGLFSAAQWTGLLAGLLVTPALMNRIGARWTVLLGLVASTVAFAIMGALSWPLWIVPGALIGFGIGLRWIANETWLYQLVPTQSSGRVVGIHEALVATAGVIGPALAVWSNVDGHIAFMAGAAFTLAAAVPLCMTASGNADGITTQPAPRRSAKPHAPFDTLVCLGMVVAAIGGLSDGALYGLFPLFADGRGMNGAQTATLLTFFGIGAMACQFPVGWFADRAGLGAAVIVCAATSTLAIFTFSLAAPSSWLLMASAVLLGGMHSSFLTLGCYAVARGGTAALSLNVRRVSIAFTAGSIVGPLLAGIAMKTLGSDMLMWQLAILSGALTAYALGLHEGRRQPDRSSPVG